MDDEEEDLDEEDAFGLEEEDDDDEENLECEEEDDDDDYEDGESMADAEICHEFHANMKDVVSVSNGIKFNVL